MFVFVLQDGTETSFGALPLAMRCERMGRMADADSRIAVPWDALTHGAFVYWVETGACDDDMLLDVMKAAGVFGCRGIGQLVYRAMRDVMQRPVTWDEGEVLADVASLQGSGRRIVRSRVRFGEIEYRVHVCYGSDGAHVWEIMLRAADESRTLLASLCRSISSFKSYLDPDFLIRRFEDASRFLRAALAGLCAVDRPRFKTQIWFTFDHGDYRRRECPYSMYMQCQI